MYIHCSGYWLNLVLAHSYSLAGVRHMAYKLKDVCLYFGSSPKGGGFLDHIVRTNVRDNKQKDKAGSCAVKPIVTLPVRTNTLLLTLRPLDMVFMRTVMAKFSQIVP